MANSGSEKKENLKLYSYWRSSCAHRVRIALALKGLEYEYIAMHLVKGNQFDPVFRFDKEINPMGTVPALVDGDVVIISDSFAIIMYLDDKYPEPWVFKSTQRSQRREIHNYRNTRSKNKSYATLFEALKS